MASKKKAIVVTGGAGYIGSHVVYALLQAGHTVYVIDNLSTGSEKNLFEDAEFIKGDFSSKVVWDKITKNYKVWAVMHLAASIDVAESFTKPMEYFKNNTLKTANMLGILQDLKIDNLIYSSTAAVYGRQIILPISENASLRPANPYGQSKFLAEELVKYYSEYGKIHSVILRYFNAVGTTPEVEVKSRNKTSLLAQIEAAVKGTIPKLKVYGDDFDTEDGTCVRDFVHVMDIARAHIAALDYLKTYKKSEIFNVGTGVGFSILEMIDAAEKVTGKTIRKSILKRREGEIPVSIADNSLIKHRLKFELRDSDLPTILGSIL